MMRQLPRRSHATDRAVRHDRAEDSPLKQRLEQTLHALLGRLGAPVSGDGLVTEDGVHGGGGEGEVDELGAGVEGV